MFLVIMSKKSDSSQRIIRVDVWVSGPKIRQELTSV
jgi:hypothetical protein